MSPAGAVFDNELSSLVWSRKYRFVPSTAEAGEVGIGDSWNRVAAAVAKVEPDSAEWHRRFLELLQGFRFLPGGRILAGAGAARDATLFNCFVMGSIDDSVAGIFEGLRESARTLQLGGGIGCDFSTIRPRGMAAQSSGRTASGPVSFMHLWDTMCATILSRGNRRGAMMGTLRVDHPDVLEFIDAKRTPGALTNFNLSVQITDRFMAALDADGPLDLIFPGMPDRGSHYDTKPSTELWGQLLDAAYDTAEPGVLYIDRINDTNNLYYHEHITATNPCGEVPLPPYGACDLGSVNLAAHVTKPFSARAQLDLESIGRIVRDAVRFLDDVIDLSSYPLAAQATEARTTRRIGLGITGLADALIMLGLRYDSDAGRELARAALTRIRDEAYAASIALAEEKGCFPCFDRDAYLAGRYVATLTPELRDAIAARGIRNSHLLAIAPAGSISILANNVSSGIEPVFAAHTKRFIRETDGSLSEHEAIDYACAAFARNQAGGSVRPPPAFVSAHELAPKDHLLMAAALQSLVDQSIAKTVNVPENIPRAEFNGIYRQAFELGLKGCTVFRRNPVTGSILTEAHDPVETAVTR